MMRRNVVTAVLAAMLMVVTVFVVDGVASGAVLLEDGFDTSADNLGLNFEQATRQGGTLGGTDAGVWLENDRATDDLLQIKGGTLQVTGAVYETSGGRAFASAALTRDFGASDIRVSYDVDTGALATGVFSAVSIGGYRNPWVLDSKTLSFDIHANISGSWYLCDSGAIVSGFGLNPGADGVYQVVMEIIDNKLSVLVEGTQVVTDHAISADLTSKYVSLGGYGDGHVYKFDNLKIESIPEPATMTLMALGGMAGLLRKK